MPVTVESKFNSMQYFYTQVFTFGYNENTVNQISNENCIMLSKTHWLLNMKYYFLLSIEKERNVRITTAVLSSSTVSAMRFKQIN